MARVVIYGLSIRTDRTEVVMRATSVGNQSERSKDNRNYCFRGSRDSYDTSSICIRDLSRPIRGRDLHHVTLGPRHGEKNTRTRSLTVKKIIFLINKSRVEPGLQAGRV